MHEFTAVPDVYQYVQWLKSIFYTAPNTAPIDDVKSIYAAIQKQLPLPPKAPESGSFTELAASTQQVAYANLLRSAYRLDLVHEWQTVNPSNVHPEICGQNGVSSPCGNNFLSRRRPTSGTRSSAPPRMPSSSCRFHRRVPSAAKTATRCS